MCDMIDRVVDGHISYMSIDRTEFVLSSALTQTM